MNLNSAIHALNANNCLFYKYQQHISYRMGLYTDGTYIDSIKVNQKDITIEFPSYCDIISNIYIPNAKFKILDGDNVITTDVIILKRYKNIFLRIYDITDINNLEIYFDVYLLQNKLKSAL